MSVAVVIVSTIFSIKFKLKMLFLVIMNTDGDSDALLMVSLFLLKKAHNMIASYITMYIDCIHSNQVPKSW
jgi:hypothetical protein